jgi:hypothetical protein
MSWHNWIYFRMWIALNPSFFAHAWSTSSLIIFSVSSNISRLILKLDSSNNWFYPISCTLLRYTPVHFRLLILKHSQRHIELQLDLFTTVEKETVFHPLLSSFFHFHSRNFWRNVASSYFSKHWNSTTIQDTSNYRLNVELRFAQAYSRFPSFQVLGAIDVQLEFQSLIGINWKLLPGSAVTSAD